MIPVQQTKFTDNHAGVHGNCMRACVASILEIDIDEIPAWEDMGSDGSWAESYYDFLELHGCEAGGLVNKNEDTNDQLWDFVERDSPGIDGYYIVGGDSPRNDRGHAVIYRDRIMVHDPHPSGVGIDKISEVYLINRITWQ